MKTLRVTTEIWISAFRAKLEKEGIPFYFYKKGEPLIIFQANSL